MGRFRSTCRHRKRCTRKLAIEYQSTQAIVISDRSKRNNVCDCLTTNRYADMLAAPNSTQGLAERLLQFADSNFAHVTTIPIT